MTGPYAAYVIGAYAVAAGALAGLALWAIIDRRAARHALMHAERAAERAGMRRDDA